MNLQLVKETALSIITVVQLQIIKAAHVLCHAIRGMTLSAVLMQYRLDVFVSHEDHIMHGTNNWTQLRVE